MTVNNNKLTQKFGLALSIALLAACGKPADPTESQAGAAGNNTPATEAAQTDSVSDDTAAGVSTEGMWMPRQLPELGDKLNDLGLTLDPKTMTDLTKFPMNAVVSLGGCSASFVSPKGLVATNHHCAYGSISYNSTEDNDLLANGFLAKTLEEEVPAAPGSRIYVTVDMNEVTDKINSKLSDGMDGATRFKAIEDAEKALVAECESDPGHRCEVYSYYGGASYYLIKQLAIRDVRLVHAPASSIGKFGGDIDNWMWPRHTGDYAFLRAYVGTDGKPADFAKDNVPYQPKHHLTVSTKGPQEGDFVMVAGYPGRTNRYRTAEEVSNNFTWYYPTMQKVLAEWSEVIGKATEDNKDAALKYASLVAGLNNYAKNFTGMMEGYNRSDLLNRKQQLEKDLQAWIDANPEASKQYASVIADLQKLISEKQSTQERDLLLGYMNRSSMLSAAQRLYRLSLEKQKPNMEREPGYQERDITRFTESMKRIERNFAPGVDQAIWTYFIERYNALPKNQRLGSFDSFFKSGLSGDALQQQLSAMYEKTGLTETESRLAWMEKSPEEFRNSDDPFIQLAVATYDDRLAIEQHDKEMEGRFAEVRPKYMDLLIAYYNEQGKPVYPDANSSLRLTYGLVKGYTPPAGTIKGAADGNDGKDGFVPFTTLRGIEAKYTGEDPFDAPQALLEAIENKDYGRFYDEKLDSVPVNFLTTVDITGGNSGSATMNGKGEFIGLVFDGTYDSINADWDFNDNTRAIHVDVEYMLWVMEKVDHADNLLEEMGVAAPKQ
ncbi:S46 family peptidase [Microbulbifer salipaludis]|uniref:Dipeptidyl-peptidase n=1 Tax=Microbulbifer salipaludis TaxID=187980 RepID=A0ABS3EAH9_9GAMM|nr:S46 family peptidase [Microbulbifer salipaludis]MBN8432281.1 S46 family peptidase [Microbulbifer salipaludis]